MAPAAGSRGFLNRPVQPVAYQEPPTPPPAPPAPGTPTPVLGNETDLTIPRAEKEEGGGAPTETEEAKEEEEEAPAAETTLLMKWLGMEDSPIKIYGWLENSFTMNANGYGNGFNFGVNPNDLANPGGGFRSSASTGSSTTCRG
jgi:hypothetical protein